MKKCHEISITSYVHWDSIVHRELHGPDAPSLVQAILCWMCPEILSAIMLPTMPDTFRIMCRYFSQSWSMTAPEFYSIFVTNDVGIWIKLSIGLKLFSGAREAFKVGGGGAGHRQRLFHWVMKSDDETSPTPKFNFLPWFWQLYFAKRQKVGFRRWPYTKE